MAEYCEREALLKAMSYHNYYPKGKHFLKGIETAEEIIEHFPAADVVPVPDGGIGELSDGYHTFNGLYYQRMVLFAALVKQNKDKAWKSLRHEDGELCFGGGWFIVGIDTPDGSYTYHYEDNFWSMFDCQELPVAKHWDGHTEKDVTRLLSLADVQPVKHGKWDVVEVEDVSTKSNLPITTIASMWCNQCNRFHNEIYYYGDPTEYANYCPHCGARMDGEEPIGEDSNG